MSFTAYGTGSSTPASTVTATSSPGYVYVSGAAAFGTTVITTSNAGNSAIYVAVAASLGGMLVMAIVYGVLVYVKNIRLKKKVKSLTGDGGGGRARNDDYDNDDNCDSVNGGDSSAGNSAAGGASGGGVAAAVHVNPMIQRQGKLAAGVSDNDSSAAVRTTKASAGAAGSARGGERETTKVAFPVLATRAGGSAAKGAAGAIAAPTNITAHRDSDPVGDDESSASAGSRSAAMSAVINPLHGHHDAAARLLAPPSSGPSSASKSMLDAIQPVVIAAHASTAPPLPKRPDLPPPTSAVSAISILSPADVGNEDNDDDL